MMLGEPAAVVRQRPAPERGDVDGVDGVVEAPPGPGVAAGGAGVLLPAVAGIEPGLEVRLADERGAVPRLVGQVAGDAGGVGGQRDAVGHHPVRAGVLAGEHRAACRLAHGVRVVGAPLTDAVAGGPFDDRGAGDGAAVAAEGVVALLVGGDEQDVAAHAGSLQPLLAVAVTLSIDTPTVNS